MQNTKTHTLLVRGVSKDMKNYLKRRGKSFHGGSTNSEVLKALDFYKEKMDLKEKSKT